MVWLELEEDNISTILIDGYVPNLEYFKKIDWNRLRKNRLGYLSFYSWQISGFYKYIYSKKITENQLCLSFRKAVDRLRYSFCPLEDKESLCAYTVYTTGKNYYSLEKYLPKFLKKESAYYLPTLVREYNYDKQRGRKGYVQNLIEYNSTPKGCGIVEKCCMDWIKKLKFTIKDKKDYIDFETFKETWLRILEIGLGFY